MRATTWYLMGLVVAAGCISIYWTQEGIESYLNSVGSSLSELGNRWSDPSEISFSVLLRSTFSLLDMCARSTNDYKHLAANQTQKSLRKPLPIVKSERRLRTSQETIC